MFSPDKPITSAEYDSLNRATFSKQLAQAILSYKNVDNLTIGLCGKWGSGKTSIINMVTDNITHITAELPIEERMLIIHFNPWNYSDRDQLIGQFFHTLCSELRIRDNSEKLRNAGDALEKYSEVLEYTSYIPVVGKYLSPLKTLVAGAGSQITEWTKEQENLSVQKNHVISALKEQSQKILIIIDDIDRLNNQLIRLIFQLVNSVAGFPNMIYLLAFDRDVVVRALEDEQDYDGEEYLEKIIQVPFDIPEVNFSQLYDILFEKLNQMISPDDLEFDQAYWNAVFNKCIAPFIKSIRDVNRVTNVFGFKYGLMHGEVNWIDLLAITAIHVNARGLFEWIANNSADLIGSIQNAGGITGDERKQNNTRITSILSDVFPQSPQQALIIIQTLFPKIGWKTGYIYSGESTDDLRHNRRIASDRHFHLYFSLSIDEIAITKSQLDATLQDYDNKMLHQFLEQVNNRNALQYYYEELRVHTEDIPQNRVEMFLDELLLWQEDTIEERGFFSSINYKGYAGYDVCLRLLKRLGAKQCLKKIKEGLEKPDVKTIVTYAKLIEDLERSYGRIGRTPNYENRIIEESDIPAVEDSLRSALTILSGSDDMYRLNRFSNLMPIWYNLDKDSL